MKEKRILAMFITSAVTLVASLAVTFGVLMTLADPVVATGVTRYEYSFNAKNNSLISTDGNTLKLKDEIVFQPSSDLIWSEDEGKESIWFNGLSYEDEIVYADESIAAKLKVIPLRITNNYGSIIQTSIKVSFDTTKILGQYTFVKLYDYATGTFYNITGKNYPVRLSAGAQADYAVVVFADQSENTDLYKKVNYGTDWLKINVEVTNHTTII